MKIDQVNLEPVKSFLAQRVPHPKLQDGPANIPTWRKEVAVRRKETKPVHSLLM